MEWASMGMVISLPVEVLVQSGNLLLGAVEIFMNNERNIK